MVRSSLQLVLSCVLLLLWAGLGGNSQAQSPDVAAAPSVDELVSQLDGDKFSLRKRARLALIDLGREAVPAVERAILADASSLEVRMLGLDVLDALVADENRPTSAAAIDALGRIAESKAANGPSRAARRMLLVHARNVADQAWKELLSLGATAPDNGLSVRIAFEPAMIDRVGIAIGDGWSGKAADLHRLRLVPSLKRIVLVGPQVTDEYLKHVAEVAGLHSVSIDSAKITVDGIAMLAKLPLLSELTIRETPLASQGDKLTDAMKKLNASQIRLIKTGLDRDALNRLVQAIPPTKSKLHFGAFLGVGPEQQQGVGGCKLGQVSVDTAAERAGLKIGDIIVSYKGKPIDNFEQLRDMIGHDSPGDVVKIEIKRPKVKPVWLPDFDLQPHRRPRPEKDEGKKPDEDQFDVLIKEVTLGENKLIQ